MAFAIVGSAGAASQGAVNTAVTPAWGAGSSRTAGNLLICFVSMTGASTAPTQPSGWSQQAIGGTSCRAIIYYRIAAGGDAAPTISAVASSVCSAHLEEWSGNAATNPQDRILSAIATTSPITATAAGSDATSGALLAMAGADFRSAARTPADTWTSNNGTPVLRASNNGVSSANHYSHATLVTTSNAAADTAIMTMSTTTSLIGGAVSAQSFKLAASTPVTGTGAGSGTASTSNGTAAETFIGTGGGTGTAATASGSGTSLQTFTGTGAGTQVAATATGTGIETVTGTGAGTQTAQAADGSGIALLAVTGTGNGTQATQTATGTAVETIIGTGVGAGTASTADGSGIALLAVIGTGSGTQAAATAAGSGLHVIAVSGTGSGTQARQTAHGVGIGGEKVVTIRQPLPMRRRRLVFGSGGGVQVPQSAAGRGVVSDDELVIVLAA